MKKLNVYATVMNINGKKSNGTEDVCGYQHWRLSTLGTQESFD